GFYNLVRMDKAYGEMSHWAEYDWVLVNDGQADTLQKINAILTSERLRRLRQLWIHDFVQNLSDHPSIHE
ncbi:MAG: hypothetical protein AAF403_08340, partial [Pseudomonadota bacterium]